MRHANAARRRLRLGAVCSCALIIAACLYGQTAAGHSSRAAAAAASKRAERRLHAYEVRILGTEHAAEHARERAMERVALRRWQRLTPAERATVMAGERAQQRTLELAAGPPSQVGAWTTAPFRLPNLAMHAAVLPTGRVLLMGFASQTLDPRPIDGYATVWDPRLGTGPKAFHDVPPPLRDLDSDGKLEPAPIYSGGHAFLPNGAVLFAGGNVLWADAEGDAYTNYPGSNRIFTFDPWRESWQEQPRMRHGRWYPSVLELASGEALMVGGYSEQVPGGIINPELEVFTNAAKRGELGRLSYHAAGDRAVSLYPHLFTLPNHDVLLAGPGRVDSALLDPSTYRWSELPEPSQDRFAGNAVMLPGPPSAAPRVEQLGGLDYGAVDANGNNPATRGTEVLDTADPAAGWRAGPPLNLPRSNENTVLLPDGTMVAVGGGSGNSPEIGGFLTDDDGRLRQVELYDPTTESWRLGPPQREDRTYHSTAMLLPSGRVLSAGDNYHPLEYGVSREFDTAEIYSPPYLFAGPRPRITLAPKSIHWSDAFSVRTRGRVARAVLMAPSATTHAADMSQRYVRLRVRRRFRRRGANLVAPPEAGAAPPGYYMLFVINAKGVPSRASWVRISAGAPDRRTLSASPKANR